MTEHISHSNTPHFSSDKSQTTARLYQHPTAAEMRTPRAATFWANAKEFAIFIALALVLWFVVTLALMYFFGG